MRQDVALPVHVTNSVDHHLEKKKTEDHLVMIGAVDMSPQKNMEEFRDTSFPFAYGLSESVAGHLYQQDSCSCCPLVCPSGNSAAQRH